MKTTLKERIRKRLQKFGRKNKICEKLAICAWVAVKFFCHVADDLKGNRKRLAMMAGVICLFAVYSSFSFPLFAAGNGEQAAYRLETDSDVELAPEADIDLESVERLMDQELLQGQETEAEDMVSYGTAEVLDALEGYGRRFGQEAGGAAETSGEMEFSRDDWRLVLINKQHSIPDDYTFSLASFMNFKCDDRILDDLADMFQAAKADGINLEIRSPYRSHEHQRSNFNNRVKLYMNGGMSYMEAYQVASRVITVPGNSEHEIGLALDITCEGFPDLIESFGDTEAGRWLAENGCKYGFIVRYPKGKEYITGITYEPWHMRYVGEKAATVITGRGITLEEFWEDL